MIAPKIHPPITHKGHFTKFLLFDKFDRKSSNKEKKIKEKKFLDFFYVKRPFADSIPGYPVGDLSDAILG